MTRTKPSGEDLANAIVIVQSGSSDTLSKKELMAAIQRQNPDWKINERRVSKYEKKLMKYQLQVRSTSAVSIPQTENGDDESAGSNASNASNVARRILRVGSSIRKTLSFRGSDRPNFPDLPPTKLIEFALEADVPTPSKTNLLPQLADESCSDDDPGFKVDADHCGTKETTSPKSSDSFDEYDATNSDEKLFILENKCVPEKTVTIVPEKTLTIDNIEVANAVIVIKDYKVVSDVKNCDDISTSNLNDEISTSNLNDDLESLGEDQEIMKDDKDWKKEGFVCEGCVIL